NLTNTSAIGNGTISVNTDITGLAVGTYTTTIRITDTNAINSPLDVPVTLTVTSNQPIITLNPAPIIFTATEGASNPANQAVTVTNSGAGTLNWAVAEAPNQNWLTLSNTTGSTGGQFFLAVDINSLSAGTYSASIQVTDSTAVNSPMILPVQLIINPEITGPVLGEFEAENAPDLPNSGWESLVNEGENAIRAAVSDISSPPAQYQLNYTFMVPVGVSEVYVFAEVDVNGDRNDDSFWVEVNENSTCTWNNLNGLKDGWARSWVYNLGKDTKHAFPVQPGSNTLNLYPRENGAAINWLVVTTDAGTNLENYSSATSGTDTPIVTVPPRISVSTDTLQFTQIENAVNTGAQTITVSNAGNGTLEWTFSETPSSSWLSAQKTEDTIHVTVNTSGLTIGQYQTSLKITAVDADNSPMVVPVILEVVENTPILTVDKTHLTFSATTGEATELTQSIVINNSGGGTLSWFATEKIEQPWLILSGAAGTDADSLKVTVYSTGLNTGSYSAFIRISDVNASNNPIEIPVDFTLMQPIANPEILAELQAEHSLSLPNDGWKIVINDADTCITAIQADPNEPNEAYRLDYNMTFPAGTEKVYIFAEIDVNNNFTHDSFWLMWNDNDLCNWNSLKSLAGDGWKRLWVFDYLQDTQHEFTVQPDTNIISIYSKEVGPYLNWLVVTTDPNWDIENHEIGTGLAKQRSNNV
ncbi:hypothetical protein KAH55_13895, partial [bacterium]|nr:hypothetical protein [bacterium]